MDPLIINKTFSTPQVRFDAEAGIIEMEGRVIPENPEEFFEPVFNWIDRFSPLKDSETKVRFRLFYYNTSSVKRLLALLRKIDLLYQAGHKIQVWWEYEEGDEDTINDGEDFKNALKVPFEIRQVGGG